MIKKILYVAISFATIFGLNCFNISKNIEQVKATSVYDYFRPANLNEAVVGHSNVGELKGGYFFETITSEKIGFNKETRKQIWRFRYYITHTGSHYIWQAIDVGIFLDGSHLKTFPANPSNNISNESRLMGEHVVEIEKGTHLVELKDLTGGGVTVVNVRKEIDVLYYIIDFNSFGGTPVQSQFIFEGETVVYPNPSPTRGTDQFIGWFKDTAYFQPYNFSLPVYSDFTLYAKWDSIPIIDAEDMVILSGMYTQEEWNKIVIERAVARDKEDGIITNKIRVISDTTQLNEVGQYLVTYQVTDSANNTVTKVINVTVHDGELDKDKSRRFVRAIDLKYIDTLEPNSWWRKEPTWQKELKDTLENDGSKYHSSWNLKHEDIEKIKAWNRTHDYSEASNKEFMKEFGHLRKEGSVE